ncbi:MAG TPA: DegT/DnrJ/EryC1/StrS family aminotransferase [Candidatus Limnocylindrales bacterium]|nr:DegT/DnrJ/EryC1/StrS family aminotransferase [Candidatus Limnocylindrales bacterium]
MHDAPLPVFKPLITPEETGAAVEALEMGWLGMGSYVGQFEDALKRTCGAADRYVAATSTGHAALHLALMAIGVGPGDEVITPAFNNIADFQAILAVGARPVFCDIDDLTLCIDLTKAETLVSERTKAIIVMDYDCVLCDHDAVARFAERHGVRVVHDAAHSLGSFYRGKPVGSFSDVTMFSFDPVKTITCIDGGALILRDENEWRRVREMRLIGMGQPAELMYQNKRAWTYDVASLGFRYHMANLHGAIGLAQLAKLPQITASRQHAARRYSAALANVEGVRVPASDFTGVTPFLYYIRVPAERRDGLRAFMAERGIDTGIHWQPGHWFTLFKDCRRGDLSVTDRVGDEVLSLPLHSMMADETVDRVADAVAAYFAPKAVAV